MKQSFKKIIFFLGIIFVILMLIVFFEIKGGSSKEKKFTVIDNDLYEVSGREKTKIDGFEETKEILTGYRKKFIEINNKIYELSVAEGHNKMVKGLSGTKSLLPNTGMLFVFDVEDMWGFWMKEMIFSIDIVWLNSSCVVVGMKNAKPDSYPEVFYPKGLSKYVLEFSSGEVIPFIKEGDKFDCSRL